MQRMIAYCIGKRVMFFEFDYAGKYFYNFDNIFIQYFCIFIITAGKIIGSNIIEVYLMGRVLFDMKKKTNIAASLLSSKALQTRKR